MTPLSFLNAGLVLLATGAQALTPAAAPADLPVEIAAAGMTEVLRAQATGAQIYTCAPGSDGKLAWTFREPVANLTVDGTTIGHHYPGPSWQLEDGSTVVGKVADKVAGTTPADIAWLRLDVVGHHGTGGLDGVSVIQRINTVGGVLTGDCREDGAQTAVPYHAEYVFLAPAG